MTFSRALAKTIVLASGLLSAPSSVAADFTFEVPIEITNFAPGAEMVNLLIGCIVTIAADDFRGSSIVAEEEILVPVGPGPATTNQIVTVEMNALNPRLRPASDARAYSCDARVTMVFPDASVSLPPSEVLLLPMYETATRGHSLTRVVVRVTGSISR